MSNLREAVTALTQHELEPQHAIYDGTLYERKSATIVFNWNRQGWGSTRKRSTYLPVGPAEKVKD